MIFYIHVKVTAGARKESLNEKKKNYFDISVKEKAERNMANTKVIELIAEYFGITKAKVRIINGHQNSAKLLVIDK